MINSYNKWLIALATAASITPGAMMAQETVTPTGSTMYGFLGYSEKNTDNGWYAINPNGDMSMLWADKLFGVAGTYFTTGWVRNDKLCGIYGNATRIYYMEFDLSTGQMLTQDQIDVSGENAYKFIRTGAYNPTDGYVYGFSFNSDSTKDYFVKAPADDISKVEIVRDMPYNFVLFKSLCYNPTDNHIYGIDTYDRFCSVDVYGNFAYLGDINLDSDQETLPLPTGMCYNMEEDAYYWNAKYSTYDSDFVRINPKSYEATIVKSLRWMDYITFMVSEGTDGMADGPQAPMLKSLDFADGAKSGSITYTLPTLNADGTAAASTLTWTATALPEGKTLTGSGAPGAEVKVDFSDLTGGNTTFAFYAQSGDKRGASVFTNTWIGNDQPYVPGHVVLAEGPDSQLKVTWDAVTKSAHDGYLDLAKMQYAVFINGEQKLLTKECEALIPYDANGENTKYDAMVVAVADGMQSEPGVSNQLIAGRGWTLPFEVIPTTEQAAQMTLINVDNDKSGWRLNYDNLTKETTFFTSMDGDNPGNDWLITPKLLFENANRIYGVSFEAAAYSPVYNQEFFEIWLGEAPTVDGMTQRIQAKTGVKLQTFEPFQYTFKVPAAGNYYIGIRSVSNADQMGWYLKNLSISMLEGVESAEADTAFVAGGNGQITVSGLAGAELTLTTADGRTAMRRTVSLDNETFSAERGLYVATAAGKAWKVLVK